MKMKMLKALLVATISFFACVTAYYCFFSSCRQILVCRITGKVPHSTLGSEKAAIGKQSGPSDSRPPQSEQENQWGARCVNRHQGAA